MRPHAGFIAAFFLFGALSGLAHADAADPSENVPVANASAGDAPSVTAPVSDAPAAEVGKASFYGRHFHGKRTASGQIFDKTKLVAAHPTYPFGTIVRVTNLRNKEQVELEIVDRGPAKWVRQAKGVIIDVSRAAAEKLQFVDRGRVKVKVEVLRWGAKGEKRLDPAPTPVEDALNHAGEA